MRSVVVPLPEDAAEQLRVLAEREYRRPKDQATRLIIEGLERAGLKVRLHSREIATLVAADKAER
jgi:hypothetical protein